MENTILTIVIPARKGSSLHHKNILPICGKPMIHYTIEASEVDEYPHITIISTNDLAVEDACKIFDHNNKYIEVRKESLCSATATLDSVMYDFALRHPEADPLVCLPPTAPLRTKKHLRSAIDTFYFRNADSVISTVKEHRSIWTTDDDWIYKPLVERLKNRQEVDPVEICNGAIFITKREALLRSKKRICGRVATYPMSEHDSVDVHTYDDIMLAEYYLGKR